MKKLALKISLFLAILFLPYFVAQAADLKTGNAVYVSKDQIVSGNLYAAGQTVTIDGTISGDLIAAAQTINVNGRVDGDIIGAAQNITVNGEVGGNIRVAGSAISLNGSVSRNINAFGVNVILGSGAKVGWDVLLMAATAEVRGEITGGLSGAVNQMLIAGKIGKDVSLRLDGKNAAQKLVLASNAAIGGNLNYTAKNAAQIDPKATIGGKANQTSPATEKNQAADWLWRKLINIFSAIVVGLFLVFVLTKITPKILKGIEENPSKTMLHGLIIMLILPPIALLLAFTVIGLPLAIIIGAWWLVATYVARIFTAILIGQLIFRKLFKQNKIALLWSLVLGVAVLWLLVAIPYVGWIFVLIAIWLGIGGVYNFVSHQIKNFPG
jgi:cytoskeletal protein CcmA (bactofilin family)